MRRMRPYLTVLYVASAALGVVGAVFVLLRALQRPFTPNTALGIGVATALIVYAICLLRLAGDLFSRGDKKKNSLSFLIAFCGAVIILIEMPSYAFSFFIAFLATVAVSFGLPLVHYLPALAILSIASLTGSAVAKDLLRAEIWLCMAATVTGSKIIVSTVWRDLILQGKLLDQARWSASRLSSITLRLDSTVKQERFLALASERKRLAGAVHDSVGYSLTALIVQLSALQGKVDDEEVYQKLCYLEEFTRALLRDTRIMVSEIRETRNEPELDWPSRWQKLCEVFGDCTGVRVHRDIAVAFPVTQDVGSVIYRVIQEGLTNSYRHGHATYIAVTVRHDRKLNMVLLKISDNGIGAELQELGNGLRGMQERVERVKGSVLWQTQPNRGFDIAVDIPYTLTNYEEKAEVTGS